MRTVWRTAAFVLVVCDGMSARPVAQGTPSAACTPTVEIATYEHQPCCPGITYQDINNHGIVVGGGAGGMFIQPVGTVAASDERYGYSENGVMARSTEALGLNDFGDSVGRFELPGFNAGAFLRAADGTFSRISVGDLGSREVAHGINNSGTIVGSYVRTVDGREDRVGFVRSVDGALSTIDARSAGLGFDTVAHGINNVGQVVGVYRGGFTTPDGDGHSAVFGFIWQGGAFIETGITINAFTAFGDTIVSDINDDGAIAGWFSDPSVDVNRGFFRAAGGAPQEFFLEGLAGHADTRVGGLNNADDVAGWAGRPDGLVDAFVASGFTCVPNTRPPTVACVGTPDNPVVLATPPDTCAITIANSTAVAGTCADAGGGLASCTFEGQSSLPLVPGTYSVLVEGTAGDGSTASCTSHVAVVDAIAPSLSLAASPSSLWPPNHELVPIALTYGAADVCDPHPAVGCRVTSNQPANGRGDGNTGADIVWQDGQLLLRAERSGADGDRVYTIACTATDASGNRTVATTTVAVPHDKGQ